LLRGVYVGYQLTCQARLGFWILYEEIQILNKTKNGARRTPIFHLPRGSWAEPTETTLPVLASVVHRSKKAKLHDLAGPFALTKGMVAEEYQDDPDLSTWAEDLRDDPEASEDDEALPLLADLLNRGSNQTLSEQAQLHLLGPTAVPTDANIPLAPRLLGGTHGDHPSGARIRGTPFEESETARPGGSGRSLLALVAASTPHSAAYRRLAFRRCSMRTTCRWTASIPRRRPMLRWWHIWCKPPAWSRRRSGTPSRPGTSPPKANR
jgi:hypothetical protein